MSERTSPRCSTCGAPLSASGELCLRCSSTGADDSDDRSRDTILDAAPVAAMLRGAPDAPAEAGRTLFGLPAHRPPAPAAPKPAEPPAPASAKAVTPPTPAAPSRVPPPSAAPPNVSSPDHATTTRRARPYPDPEVKVPGPGAQTLLHLEAGEILAAARIATAGAEARRLAAARRTRRALQGMLVLALLAAVAGAAWRLGARRFDARVAQLEEGLSPPALTVERRGAAYTISVALQLSAPGTVRLPAGALDERGEPLLTLPAPFERGSIAFRMPESALAIGDNRLVLEVAALKDPSEVVSLQLDVRVVYRFSTNVGGLAPSPASGEGVVVEVQAMQGWRVSSPGAVVTPPREATRPTWEVRVRPETLQAALERAVPDSSAVEVPFELVLDGPNKEQLTVRERLSLQVPTASLLLVEPPSKLRTARDSVRVTGVSSPGARVQLGETIGTADDRGAFRLQWPLPTLGPHTVVLSIRAPGRTPTQQTLEAVRVDKTLLVEARRAFVQATAGTPALPEFQRIVDAPASHVDRRFLWRGRVLAVRRVEAGGKLATDVQVSVCPGDCPVFARVEGDVLVLPGDDARVSGRFVGVEAYRAQSGETRSALRFEAAEAVPL